MKGQNGNKVEKKARKECKTNASADLDISEQKQQGHPQFFPVKLIFFLLFFQFDENSKHVISPSFKLTRISSGLLLGAIVYIF